MKTTLINAFLELFSIAHLSFSMFLSLECYEKELKNHSVLLCCPCLLNIYHSPCLQTSFLSCILHCAQSSKVTSLQRHTGLDCTIFLSFGDIPIIRRSNRERVEFHNALHCTTNFSSASGFQISQNNAQWSVENTHHLTRPVHSRHQLYRAKAFII